jgi:cation:H+ antiporter
VLSSLALFAASLAVLLAAARAFTHSAERIGFALGLSPFTVGVLIVSAGTSLPELVASVVAVNRGTSEIVVGNVLGANLSNLLLVMGAVAVAAPRQVRLGEQYILIDQHFLLGSVFLLWLTLRDMVLTRVEGAVLLAAYLVYVIYLSREARVEAGGDGDSPGAGRGGTRAFPRRQLVLAAASAALIYFAARSTVSSLESLALQLGIAPAIIALTLLSLGTTLPELVVSATAARAGKADVAVGNILGSCVFNALAVTGVASLVGPVSAPEDMLALPLPVFGASALLFYLLTLDKRVSRWEGLLFLLLYGLFILEVARLV